MPPTTEPRTETQEPRTARGRVLLGRFYRLTPTSDEGMQGRANLVRDILAIEAEVLEDVAERVRAMTTIGNLVDRAAVLALLSDEGSGKDEARQVADDLYESLTTLGRFDEGRAEP